MVISNPENETIRLQALKNYQILDTPAEEEFDEITSLTSEILKTPIAVISLTDEDRQWFKSKVGLGADSIPREMAMCAYAILETDILEVPDASKDERFKNSPLVTGDLKVRFYAGAPLIDSEGNALGTLCILDSKPRTLSDDERVILKRLARQALKLIELRCSRNRYKRYLESTHDLIYELDHTGTFLFANEGSQRVLGYSFEELSKLTCWDLMRDGEREEALEVYLNLIKKKASTSYNEFPVITKSGEVVHVGQTVDFQYEGNIMVRAFVVSKDVTEIVEAREEIHRKTNLYELVSEGSSDMICLHEPNGNFTFVSAAVRTLLGYEPEELIGKNGYDFSHPDFHESFKEQQRPMVQEENGIERFEFMMRHKDGHYVWMESYAKPIFDEEGNVISVQTSSRDISLRKKGELDLLNANAELAKYKDGLKALNSLNFKSEAQLDLQLKEGLKICREFLDFPVAVITSVLEDGKHFRFLEIDAHADATEVDRSREILLEETLAGETLVRNEPWGISDIPNSKYADYSVFTEYGMKSHIGVQYEIEGKKAGTINFYSSSSRDRDFLEYELDFIDIFSKWVSELIYRDENSKKLLVEYEILKAFVLSAPAAIGMFDTELRYIAASENWYYDYGISEDVIGVSHYEIFPEIGEDWKQVHKRCLKGSVERREEDEFVREDGTVQWLRWEIRPWFKHGNEIGGIIMYTDDITEMKLQAKELEIAKEQAVASSKAKENFLSTMSHEIRTPLNAIIGTTKLLTIENPELAKNERFNLLEFSSSNLLELINNVLDYNKMESGKFELERKPIDLNALLSNVVESWEPTAHENGVFLNLSLPEERLGVIADPIRIGQILNNLISNAIKFTKEGMVKVSLVKKAVRDEYLDVELEVRDSGMGIPEEHLDKIFDSFHQVTNSDSDFINGTGLGLAIVKKLVTIMGGEISVSSQVDLGTSFKIQLSKKISTEVSDLELTSKSEISIDKMNVLLVEDNLANQSIATGFLDKWGVNTTIANNGMEAVIALKNSQEFDVVLMDVRMPLMNGYEATKKIRQMEGDYFKNVPIIALTASTMNDVKSRIFECGMNALVGKPFDPDVLLENIAKYGTIPNPWKATAPKEGVAKRYRYLASLFDSNEQKIKELLQVSIMSLNEAMEELEAALVEENKDQIREALHILKPNLDQIDLVDLAANAPTVKDDDFNDRIAGWVSLVKDEIAKVKEDIS